MLQQQQQFLTLSSEVSEPFIIPNISPVSSPKLQAKKLTGVFTTNNKKPEMGDVEKVTPLKVIEEDEPYLNNENDDATLISTRNLSIIDLN
ncbi:unnamed protein product [Candida verbasci]|uniref:Uncharacterized protein n=1 Tax=Candida verbasci TaxID=1227364 RepID=A0A9W4TRK0_9ASCO|nr:unnamed protein product [Candida verbasci]